LTASNACLGLTKISMKVLPNDGLPIDCDMVELLVVDKLSLRILAWYVVKKVKFGYCSG
jgi:hypothetical protein